MRRWVMLGVLVAVLLGAVWWFFFISPRNAQISQADEDLRMAQDQQMALAAQVAQLQAIRDSEVEYLAGIGQLETLIPERPLLDQFIEDIDALCNTTGVELLNLAPAMPVAMTGSSLRQVTVAMSVDGDFFEVLGFLFGVMDMDRLVRVDAISLASGQDETGATTLSASLSLRLFTLADLVPIAVTPEAGAGTTPETSGGTTPEAQTTIAPSTTTPASVPNGEG